MKELLLALAVGIGLSASALTVETISDDGACNFASSALGSSLLGEEEPPGGYGGGGDKPSDKPDKPSGEGGEEHGGGETKDTATLTGLLQLDGGTTNLVDGTLSSTTSDQNVILAQTNATVTVSNYTLNKSGDTSSEDNSNFYALNAVVAAKTAAKVYIDNSVLNSNANGANCLFASGSNSTIYAYNCTITSTKDSSRGLDATYEGTVIASKVTINTSGDHCASLATDRGNGYISAKDSTLSTAGQGSALIYSTGIIEANCVTGTATGAQIAGIEGLSTIRIKNSDLTGSGEKASEPVANGVIIYQSNSGDSTDGTATFEVSDSTLASAITNGAMFYITHSEAVITVQNTILDFDTDSNYLLNAAGNDGEHGWGDAGSNGAEVIFTAIDQTLSGDIAVDGISAVDMYLIASKYTGTFVADSTNAGDGDTHLHISSNSTWVVTADCTLQKLTAAEGAMIVDGSGNSVRVVNSSGTVLRAGTSDLEVTVTTYASANVSAPYTITEFEIDRTNFESMYATELVTPGTTSESYDDALSATNAAVKINQNKISSIAIPAVLEESFTNAYLGKIEATVTSDNCVVVDLTPAAQSNEQIVVDAAVTNEDVVAALVSTNASEMVTIATTTPGLYYWIAGGTDVSAITNAGSAKLSTNGGSLELSKPTLDATKGKAFFKIAVGVSAPAQSTDD